MAKALDGELLVRDRCTVTSASCPGAGRREPGERVGLFLLPLLLPKLQELQGQTRAELVAEPEAGIFKATLAFYNFYKYLN